MHYFDRSEADPSDKALKQAIAQRVVPERCLLQGVVVLGIAEQGDDPCATCHGPRDRCGGRARTAETADADSAGMGSMHPSDATYRRLIRTSWRKKLDELVPGGPKKESNS